MFKAKQSTTKFNNILHKDNVNLKKHEQFVWYYPLIVSIELIRQLKQLENILNLFNVNKIKAFKIQLASYFH